MARKKAAPTPEPTPQLEQPLCSGCINYGDGTCPLLLAHLAVISEEIVGCTEYRPMPAQEIDA